MMKKINKLLLLISSAALLFSACTEISSDASSGSAASAGTFVKIVDSSDERTIAPAIGKNAEGFKYVYTLNGAVAGGTLAPLSDERVDDWNKFIAKAIPITGNGKYDFELVAESYNGSDTYYDPIKIKLSGVDITPGETNKLAFTPENGAVYDVTVVESHRTYKGGINVTFKGLSGVTGAKVELLDSTGAVKSTSRPFTQEWVTSPSGTEVSEKKRQTLSNNTINYKLDRDSATEQLAGGQYYLRLTLYADHSFDDTAKLNSYKESVLVVEGLTSTATRTFDSANLNKVHKVTYHNADMSKVDGQSYSEAYTRYTDKVSVPYGADAFDVEGKKFKYWCDAEGNKVPMVTDGTLTIAEAETAKVINDNGDIDLYASWKVDFGAKNRLLSKDVKVGDIVFSNGLVIPYEAGLVLDTFDENSAIRNAKVVGVVFYNNIGAAATKAGLGKRILVVAPKNSYDVGYSWVEKTDEVDGGPVINGAQLVKDLAVYVGGESTGEIKAAEKYQYGSTVYRKWFDADDKSKHFGFLSGNSLSVPPIDSLSILKKFDAVNAAADKLNASYPAFGYVNDLRTGMTTYGDITEGERTPDTGYYLPSVAELLELSSNVATVNKSLALKLIRAKGAVSETVTVGDQLSGRFWSCSQALGTQSQRAWSVDLDTGSARYDASGNFGSQTKSDKTALFKVCGVIGYTANN